MNRTVLLFPGQGSQRPGMASELISSLSEFASDFYAEADEILGYPFTELCSTGTAEELRPTEVAQPAIYMASVVMLQAVRNAELTPTAVIGHSLGEYAALVAAGALDWRAGLRLVATRGQLMAAAGAANPGAMAAIIGVSADEVDKLVEGIDAVVEVANYNDPLQTVISGTVEGVDAAMQLSSEFGAARFIALPVSAPFHSSLMAPAVEKFTEALAATPFTSPSVPFIANGSAEFISDPQEIRSALARQLSGSVRFTQSLTALARMHVDTFIEVGPGRVLTGFVRNTLPESNLVPTGDARRLLRALAKLTAPPAEVSMAS